MQNIVLMSDTLSLSLSLSVSLSLIHTSRVGPRLVASGCVCARGHITHTHCLCALTCLYENTRTDTATHTHTRRQTRYRKKETNTHTLAHTNRQTHSEADSMPPILPIGRHTKNRGTTKYHHTPTHTHTHTLTHTHTQPTGLGGLVWGRCGSTSMRFTP